MATPSHLSARYKLIFYTPLPPLQKIKSALFAAGAGTYPDGKYNHVSFESRGTGQFMPRIGANPHTGTIGVIEAKEEMRVEMLCAGEDVVKEAVKALKREHPYEEVAYEVYKMEDF
ncbi:structural toxin protein RtxA [Tirmania nivea]|nr:structural toxin protein RtxA [Tirmania nivea]